MRRFLTILLLAALGLGAQAIPRYRGAEWRHWISQAGGCDTRQTVLIRESKVPVTKRGACTVLTGEWYDPYSGETFTRPQQLDVDHVVPLENAHRSGGWAWERPRKEAHANDPTEGHLLAVSARLNRQKGSKGPEAWVPPSTAYQCQYGRLWDGIKE